MSHNLTRIIHGVKRGIIRQQVCVSVGYKAVGGAVAPAAGCCVTVQQALSLWAQHFRQCSVPEPLLSSQYIIAHVLGKKTLAGVERKRLGERLSEQERVNVWELCSKRLTRMPVQYIIEEWDFRDLTLKMRPPVFIPRPETEELVGVVLEDLRGEESGIVGRRGAALRCLEVGCGSGGVSLSLLHSLPQLRAVALDQSRDAVSLTEENANRLGLQDRLEVHHLDVIKDADVIVRELGPVDVLVSNPPYLFTQDMETLQEEILRFEDHAALDGGLDGMTVIQQILTIAPKLLTQEGRVYLEVDPRHPPIIQRLVEEEMWDLQYVATHFDLSKRPRFCVLQRRG